MKLPSSLFLLWATALPPCIAQHAFTPVVDAQPGKLSDCYRQFRGEQRLVLGWSLDMTIACLGKEAERLWRAFGKEQRGRLVRFASVAMQDGKAPRQVVGLCGTMLSLLGGTQPQAALQHFPGLGDEIAAEAADVRERRKATPRFVVSWDPGTPTIDWSLWKPEGIAAVDPTIRELFLAAVYVRHADGERAPAVAAWLATAMRDNEKVGEAMAAMLAFGTAEQALMGTPCVGLLDPKSGQGTLVPSYRPDEADELCPALRRLCGLPVAAEAGSALHFAAGVDDRSVRRGLLATFDAVMAETEVDQARRMQVAVFGYTGLRECDVVATARGPTTGPQPRDKPWLYVEPHLAVLDRALDVCQRMAIACTALGDTDGVSRCQATRRLFAALRRCVEAEQHGECGSDEDMDAILDAWKHSDDMLDHPPGGVTIRPVPADGSVASPGIMLRRDGMVPASGKVTIGGGEFEVWTALVRCSFRDEQGTWKAWGTAPRDANGH